MTLRRLIPFTAGARADAALGLLLLGLAAAAEVAQPWPVKWLVDHVLGSVAPPGWLAGVLAGPKARSLAFICSTIVLVAVLHRAILVVAHYLLVRAGNKLVTALRTALCGHLHALSPAYHDKTRVGDSAHRLAYDTLAGLNAFTQVATPTLSGVLSLVGVLAVTLAINPWLTLVAVLAVPLLWVQIHLFGRLIDRRAKAYHESENAMAAEATEALTQIRVVQAFGREQETAAKITARAGRSLRAMQNLVLVQLIYGAGTALALAAGTAGVVYAGASLAVAGSLSTGDVLVFLAYVGMLYVPLNQISQAAAARRWVGAQLDRVFAVLDTPSPVVDRPGAKPLEKVRGRVEFDHVSFGYDPETVVIKDVSLSVPAGQTVAFVGRTGSGKTTLMNLLTRFYDPTGGSVRLDGVDLRDLPLAWLRDQVSVVLQDAMLISGTVRENIALGARRGTAPTDVDLVRAATRAQADAFIAAMPGGYDAALGERGTNLSGGQRQRLALARAFLKDAPILILDEPSSALDAHTEAALVDAVRDLARGRTTFIVAHRLSTIRLADQIVVMDGGRIVEAGTHRELLAREDSAYRALYRAQVDAETADLPGLPEPDSPAAARS